LAALQHERDVDCSVTTSSDDFDPSLDTAWVAPIRRHGGIGSRELAPRTLFGLLGPGGHRGACFHLKIGEVAVAHATSMC
jgi:hypothetical protein